MTFCRDHRLIAWQLVPKILPSASRSQIEFVTKSEEKKRKDNKIMMMMLRTSALIPRIQDAAIFFLLRSCLVFCAPFHNISRR